MALRHDTGIVLRSFPFGEADRVVVLLSPDHGKLRTVAKGVRKTKSCFGGRLEPFTHVELVLYEGRNLDTINQVEMIEGFPRLRSDLERVTAASTMLEVVDAVAQEGESSIAIFELLRQGLTALDGPEMHPDLVPAFLLHLLGAIGLAPALGACAACGTSEHLWRFSFAGGGVICDRCRSEGSVRLRGGVVEYMARLASTRLAELPEPDGAISGEVMGVVRRFIEHHLDRRLMSLAVVEA